MVILTKFFAEKTVIKISLFFLYSHSREGNIDDINDENKKNIRRKWRYPIETDENSKTILT